MVSQRTYASPMSFTRSTKSTVVWARRTLDRNPAPWFRIIVGTGVVLILALMWSFLVMWYMLAFFFFGLWVIPFRLIRRGQRRRNDVAAHQIAYLDAATRAMERQLQTPLPPVEPPQSRELPR